MPAAGEPLLAGLPDAIDLGQTLRLLLDDLEYLVTKHLYQFGGEMGADAFDEAGAEEPLHPFRAARMGGANRVSFELLSMVTVYDPATVGFDVLTGNRKCEMSNDRDEVTMTFDDGLEDSEAIVGVVERYSFDAASESFGATVHAGIIPQGLEDPMREFW